MPRESSNPAATISIPQAPAATAAAGRPPRHPEPDATAPGGGEKTPPTRAQGCGTAALAKPLRRVTRSIAAAVACGVLNCGPTPRRPGSAATGGRMQNWLVQVFARSGRHGAGPSLPSAALPRRGDRGLALAGSGGAPHQPKPPSLHDLPLLPASPRPQLHPPAHLPSASGADRPW